MSIRSILKGKGGKVVTVTPSTTIGMAAQRLRLERIGAVVVSSDGKQIEGILSERDIVYGLTEHGSAVTEMPVSALMSHKVYTCRPDTEMREVMRLMTSHRIRHLPVAESNVMLGIVSIGDVVQNRLQDMELEANVLHDVIVARA